MFSTLLTLHLKIYDHQHGFCRTVEHSPATCKQGVQHETLCAKLNKYLIISPVKFCQDNTYKLC